MELPATQPTVGGQGAIIDCKNGENLCIFTMYGHQSLQGVFQLSSNPNAAQNPATAQWDTVRYFNQLYGVWIAGNIPVQSLGSGAVPPNQFPDVLPISFMLDSKGRTAARFLPTAFIAGPTVLGQSAVVPFDAGSALTTSLAGTTTGVTPSLDSFITQYTPPAAGTGQIPNMGVLPQGSFGFLGEIGTEGGPLIQDRLLRVRMDRMEEWLRRTFFLILGCFKDPDLSKHELLAAIMSDDGTGNDTMDNVYSGDHQPAEVG